LISGAGVEELKQPDARLLQSVMRHLHKIEVFSGVLLIVGGGLVFTRHLVLLNSWLNHISFFRSMTEKFL
jgi:hypothetical protein